MVASVLLCTGAAGCVCAQRWQSESGVLEAVLVTLTFPLCENWVFKRQSQKGGFQNSDLS